MGWRCSSCNLLCSVELAEPETDDLSLDGDTITGSIRLLLESACCGEEVADSEEDVEISIDHDCPENANGKKELDFELTECSAAATDRFDGDAKAKMRYRRHFYGADITATIHCNHCGGDEEVSGMVECQASGFEAL